MLEKCKLPKKKCWKSVIFHLYSITFTLFFVYLQPNLTLTEKGCHFLES